MNNCVLLFFLIWTSSSGGDVGFLYGALLAPLFGGVVLLVQL